MLRIINNNLPQHVIIKGTGQSGCCALNFSRTAFIMSLRTLKKEIQTLDQDQLRNLIVEVYNAKLPAKTFLDFYLDPDVNALIEKYQKNILKELSRVKYGRCIARITRLQKYIKEFECFATGSEDALGLRLFVLRNLIAVSRYRELSPTLLRGVAKFIQQTVAYADKNMIFDSAFSGLKETIESTDGSRRFKSYIRTIIEATQSSD